MNGHLIYYLSIIEVKFTKTKHIQSEQNSFSINVIYVKQDSPGQLTAQTTKVAIKNIYIYIILKLRISLTEIQ